MELCVASVLILVASLTVSDDGARISTLGFFHRWNYQTFIPILTNAMGGIVVGLVTKHAGSVQKGFALIFGILLSGILQQLLEDEKNTISRNQVISGSLAALSLWMHAAYPHRGQDCSTNMPKTDTATWTRIYTPTSASPVCSIQTRRKTRKED
jgi:UDP-sugar transporter A1/2/3